MKKTIKLNGVDPMIFAGANDENMKIILNNFESNIVLRGNHLYVDGKKKDVKIAATISDVKKYVTKKGKMAGVEMAFMCIEDHTGTLDTVTVFAEKWKEYKNVLYEGNNVILVGQNSKNKRYQLDDGLIVESIIELS